MSMIGQLYGEGPKVFFLQLFPNVLSENVGSNTRDFVELTLFISYNYKAFKVIQGAILLVCSQRLCFPERVTYYIITISTAYNVTILQYSFAPVEDHNLLAESLSK